jgi:hypothetical protein
MAAYERAGVPFEGFRCPYLSYTSELAEVLPPGAFSYSSNEAIAWDVTSGAAGNPVFSQLARFYSAAAAGTTVSAPALRDGLVEIPASIPDDLQLWDALAVGVDGVARAWGDALRAAHGRSELFAPLFHPESFDLIRPAVENVLQAARGLRPAVWPTQLRELARWWRERGRFAAHVVPERRGLRVVLECSERGTVLVRGLAPDGAPWDGRWSVLATRELRVRGSLRPFVGVRGLDARTRGFLREQGYVLDAGPEARACSVVLDPDLVERLGSPVRLVEHIETSPGPLVKFSRWPAGAKAAICFAGDLDALSTRDYARRLVSSA